MSDAPPPRRVPLRRAVLPLAALAALAVPALVAAVLVANARASVRSEVESAFALARGVAVTRLPSPFGNPDALPQALQLAAEIDALRHVSAEVLDPRGRPRAETPAPDPSSVPGWFARLMAPPVLDDRYAVTSYPHVLGLLHLRSDPQDELLDVWRDARLIVPVLALVGAGLFGLAFALTQATARRLEAMRTALARIRDGGSAQAPRDWVAEWDALGAGVTTLGAHLAHERAENGRLQLRLIGTAEAERARIAHDLHDALGPELFALRAAAEHARTATGAAQQASLDAVARHAGAVQAATRAAINDLRPMLMGQASLAELVEEQVAQLDAAAGPVRLSVASADAAPNAAMSDVATLSLLRFVREAVLNALRHGAPSQVEVSLDRDAEGAVVVRVADDGQGPRPGFTAGYGTTGIADRARALGARYTAPMREGGRTVTTLQMGAGA